jgi:hypothetical protein
MHANLTVCSATAIELIVSHSLSPDANCEGNVEDGYIRPEIHNPRRKHIHTHTSMSAYKQIKRIVSVAVAVGIIIMMITKPTTMQRKPKGKEGRGLNRSPLRLPRGAQHEDHN